jgi:hypothetical protein
MRLVKLIAYALLGYVIYELYLGVSEGAAGSSRSNKLRQNESGTSGAPQRTNVPAEDANGARGKRRPARGIAHE